MSGFANGELVGRDAIEVCPGLSRLDLGEEGTWRSVRMRKRDGQVYVGSATVATGPNGVLRLLVRPLPDVPCRTLFPKPRPRTDPSKEAPAAIPTVTCNPRPLVDSTVARVRRLAGEAGVEIVRNVECGLVSLRPDVWSAALYELVLNAVRASRTGDAVFVDVTDVGDGDTLWQVQDTGAGISPDVLATLGSPNTTGGINLVRIVVEMHGALLRFESTLGAGTAASILLPRSGREWVRGRSGPSWSR